MSIYGGTLDAITVDPATGLPAPGVEVYAFDTETAGTLLGSALSDLTGGFSLDLPELDLDRVWVSTSTTGQRFPVDAREALGRKANTADVDAALAVKANAATVGALTTRVDTTETRVGTVEDELSGRLSEPVLSSTFASKSGALTPLKKMLDRGRCAVVQVLGDSTGNATDEWVYQTAQELAARYPAHTVRHRGWNITTEAWDAPTVIQSGTAGERYIEFDGATSAALQIEDSAVNSVTGDIDIRVKVAADNYTGAGPYTLAAKFDSVGTRSWQFYLAGGWLNFRWSADGSALLSNSVNANGLGALPANGTARWFRVTLDVDNGAGGNDTKYWRSDDGVTWTQVGATQTAAGVTSLADVSTALNVGARSGGVAERFDGKIYAVEIRNGIDGPLVAPTQVDLWNVWPSTFNGEFQGAPVLDVWNGSGSGYKMDTILTHRAEMMQPLGQTVTFVSCSHNDFGELGTAYWGKWDTLVTHIKSMAAMSSLAFVAQNPRTAPASFITPHATRATMLHGYAQKQGAVVIDVFQAFEDYDGPISDLVMAADGVHPTFAGSDEWTAEVMRHFV